MLFCALPLIDRCIFLSGSIIASQSTSSVSADGAQLLDFVPAWFLSVDPARYVSPASFPSLSSSKGLAIETAIACECSTDCLSSFAAMAPNKKGAQKPKANAAEEVEETFQAVVCRANLCGVCAGPAMAVSRQDYSF